MTKVREILKISLLLSNHIFRKFWLLWNNPTKEPESKLSEYSNNFMNYCTKWVWLKISSKLFVQASHPTEQKSKLPQFMVFHKLLIKKKQACKKLSCTKFLNWFWFYWNKKSIKFTRQSLITAKSIFSS